MKLPFFTANWSPQSLLRTDLREGVLPSEAVFCTATCKDGYDASAPGYGGTYAEAQTNANNKLKLICAVRGGVKSFDTCTPVD